MEADWRNELDAWLAPFAAALRNKTRRRMNGAGLPEAFACELRCVIDIACGDMRLIFGFGKQDVANGHQQLAMVEIVHQFELGVFDCFESAPWSAPTKHFSFLDPLIGSPKALYYWFRRCQPPMLLA